MADDYRLAGWVTLDLRMLAVLVAFSLAVAVLVVALHLRDRRWYDYLSAGTAVFVLMLALALWATQAIGVFPALRVETLFSVP
jgi:hypothetical protein